METPGRPCEREPGSGPDAGAAVSPPCTGATAWLRFDPGFGWRLWVAMPHGDPLYLTIDEATALSHALVPAVALFAGIEPGLRVYEFNTH